MEILKKEKSHFPLFIFRFVLSLWNVADWFIYESLSGKIINFVKATDNGRGRGNHFSERYVIAVPIWQNKTVNFSFFMFGTFFARCFASLLKDDG